MVQHLLTDVKRENVPLNLEFVDLKTFKINSTA